MKVTTLRLPESMYEALEDEAEEEEKSVSEYIRGILRQRENTQPNTQANTTEYDDRIRDLEQRVGDLEERLPNLEPIEQWKGSETAESEAKTEEQQRKPEGERTENPVVEQRTEHTALEDQISRLDVPGQGEKEARRREAVGAALEYIREHGQATPADLRENVYPDYQAGYTTGKNPPRSWWKNCVYPALRELAENDPRLEKGDARGLWSYQSESPDVYDPTAEF